MAVISPLYFAILATVFAGTTVDYCNIKTCKNKRIHTMCKYTSSIPARACGQLYSVGLNDADRKVITNKHNELRQKVASGNEKRGKPGPQPPAVRMPNLTWDNELEKIAQRWANQCKWDHDDCRNVERYAVGQNIAKAYSTGENTFTLSGMIEFQWYDEVKNFSRNGVSSYIYDGKKTGHYTQIVWAKTVKIGCGLINFKNSSMNTKYLVCNYGPRGNVENMEIYAEK